MSKRSKGEVPRIVVQLDEYTNLTKEVEFCVSVYTRVPVTDRKIGRKRTKDRQRDVIKHSKPPYLKTDNRVWIFVTDRVS